MEAYTTEKGFTGKLPDGLDEKETLRFSVEGKDIPLILSLLI